MKFAINSPNFGAFSDPRAMSALAQEAEDAGWDGFFVWDHMLWTQPVDQPVADPYILLAAMAASTQRLKLGALVTPIARRRPWKLAREATTLDHFSGGRLVVGVGIGGDWFGDYSTFGEPADDKTHAEMLDEGLAVLAGLWSGEQFSFEGKHYTVKDARFLPVPVQQPRIPVWVAGRWPNKKPFERAAQWDGVFPLRTNSQPMSPADFREALAYIGEHRTGAGQFDVVHAGSPADMKASETRDEIASYSDAGVTWWLVGFDVTHTLEQVREQIRNGPPPSA